MSTEKTKKNIAAQRLWASENRRHSRWQYTIGFVLALAGGACFTGDFAQGLPCESDSDCGPQLQCLEGLCGGLGDPALCGNGLLDTEEECDDGNLRDGDACTPSCRFPVCGDGYAALNEACDDGNTDDGDDCTATCQRPPIPATCGNGSVESGEECDDGNLDEGDTCTPACRLPICGDGFLASGEECDDGNDIGTDACTPQCALPVCGDGYVNADDVCDDGNDVETDECTTTCTLSPEAPVLELNLSQVKQFNFRWEPAVGAEWYELYERENEQAEFVQVGGMLETESYSMTVPLHFRTNASYQLRACNAFRCVESAELDVSGTLAEAVGYVKASNTGTSDNFGFSVVLSADGNTMVVGADKERSNTTGIDGDQEDNSLLEAGAVYVFVRTGETWEQQAYIKASNTELFDSFGFSVAVSADGNTLAVGAPYESSAATGINGDQNDNSAGLSGAVYVFTRTGETWEQQAYVKASNTNASDIFGFSVALSADGNKLAVGAYGEQSGATGVDGDQENNFAEDAGAVYTFTRTGETWEQQSYIKASNTGIQDSFGFSLALSADGTTMAVGSVLEASGATGIDGNQDDNSATWSGAVYVFTQIGETWEQQAYLKASNTEANDLFGLSLAISEDGDTLAVGAYGEESGATGIDGDQGDNSADDAGAVYMFLRSGDEWTQQAYLKASNTEANEQFGVSVAMSASGDVLVVGARYEDSRATGINGDQNDNSTFESGAAYMFTRTGVVWEHHAYIKAANPLAGDHFRRVALDGDASTLAIGAGGDNYATTGVGNELSMNAAFNSGAVYLY